MEHNQAYELIESYVFGSLEDAEVVALEKHLDSGCEACLARLREAGDVSTRLAEALPQHSPPARVRDKVFAAIGAEGGPQRATASGSRAGWTASAVMAAALAVIIFWTSSLQRQLVTLRGDLDTAHQEVVRLHDDMTAYQAAARLLGKPCTQLVDLAGVNPNPQASGRVMLHPHEQEGVVYVYQLPPTPEGMEYQLWLMRDGAPRSVGVFSVADDGTAVFRMQSVPDPLSIAEFRVTIEPYGGVEEPTGMLYLAGANTMVEMDAH
jgi:anti-sigma-K factor RskA